MFILISLILAMAILCLNLEEMAATAPMEIVQPAIEKNKRFNNNDIIAQQTLVTSSLQCVQQCYVTTTCIAINISPVTSVEDQTMRQCEVLTEEASGLEYREGWLYVGK